MHDFSVGFLGAGRVARIMVQGWQSEGQLPRQILVFDQDPRRSAAIATLAPTTRTVATAREACQADVVFLAVHPPVLLELLAEIRSSLRPGTLVVSLAPKHTLAVLQAALDGHASVARVNPSAPGIVGKGINPWCTTEQTTAEQTGWLKTLLAPLGMAPRIEEAKVEPYALVSAMGPTYFWFQWKALQDLAVEFGLDPDEAAIVVEQMVHGAAQTLYHSGLSADEVQDLVPVKPMADQEDNLRAVYREKLTTLLAKIRP